MPPRLEPAVIEPSVTTTLSAVVDRNLDATMRVFADNATDPVHRAAFVKPQIDDVDVGRNRTPCSSSHRRNGRTIESYWL